VVAYDADNERRRKEQLKRLFDRTAEQVDEEQNLIMVGSLLLFVFFI